MKERLKKKVNIVNNLIVIPDCTYAKEVSKATTHQNKSDYE